MQQVLCCFAFVLCLVALSAAHSLCVEESQTFAKEGEACSDSISCQNYLFCVNNTCQQIDEGDNCTTSDDCGGGFLQCLEGKCSIVFRTVGDPCDLHAECLSGKCDNETKTCAATLAALQPCDLSDPASAFACPEACVPVNGTFICDTPIPQGDDCTEAWTAWTMNPKYNTWSAFLPEYMCEAGSACIYNATSRRYNCQRLFAQSHNKPCQVQGIDGTCLYNLTCQLNSTNGNGLYCSNYTNPPPKNTQILCDLAALPTLPPECPFGTYCGCSKNDTNATCLPFFGGSICTDFLTSFVNCIAKHDCPYIPVQFPFTGGASMPFVVEAYAHTCAYMNCRIEHANFLCCQNNATLFSGAASVARPFSPINKPGDGYCKLHTGWPNWVIPVIVLSGIVVVVSVIVVIYVIARRRPDADYDPINK